MWFGIITSFDLCLSHLFLQDRGVLEHMGRLGFAGAHAVSSVLNNACNTACALYHLLVSQRRLSSARLPPTVPSHPPLDKSRTLPAMLPSSLPAGVLSPPSSEDEEAEPGDSDDLELVSMGIRATGVRLEENNSRPLVSWSSCWCWL